MENETNEIKGRKGERNEYPTVERPQPVRVPFERPEPYRPYKKEKSGIPVWAFVGVLAFSILLTFMITFVLVGYTAGGYGNDTIGGEKGKGGLTEEAYWKLSEIERVLGESFLYDIDEKTLTDTTIKGYMYGLGDPYAEYFTAEEFKILTEDFNAEMQGIGVSVTYNQEYNAIQIITVFPESPAYEAGVRPGDIIAYINVDGESVSVAQLGYTMAVNKLQGEAGTLAEFTVFRGKDLSESVDFSIERGFITEYTVMGRVHSENSKVGIITITSFDKETPNQFKKTYEELLAGGCTSLIIDVRNNPGGELMSVCTTLDMLVPEGPVIRTVDKAGNEEVVYTSDKNETDIPIAVLVNENTASAGELFAACLKDYKKANLVGVTTFGKGSMQTTMSFNDGTAFKYTYRYYCPPFSDNYDGVGIKPDVVSELSEEARANLYTLTDSEDTQLADALATLTK